MTKERKPKETDKIQETEQLSNAKSSKKRGGSKFFLYLIFMFLLAAGSGFAVYHMTPLVLASLAPKTPITLKTIPAAKAQSLSEQKTTEFVYGDQVATITVEENEITPSDPFETEDPVYTPEEKVEAVVQTPVIVEAQIIPPQHDIIQPEYNPQPRKKMAPYSVLKAMELRDAFKNGEECRPLLEELVAIPNKSAEIDQALVNLLQACLDRPLSDQMKQAFYQARKRAILRIFQAKYPTYLAYIKTIPYLLANIHKKHPGTNNPLDILDRIQNAVDQDHPQLVLTLIPELPENVQATLNDVARYAEAESSLYKTLNYLMKALFDGEER